MPYWTLPLGFERTARWSRLFMRLRTFAKCLRKVNAAVHLL